MEEDRKPELTAPEKLIVEDVGYAWKRKVKPAEIMRQYGLTKERLVAILQNFKAPKTKPPAGTDPPFDDYVASYFRGSGVLKKPKRGRKHDPNNPGPSFEKLARRVTAPRNRR